MQDTLEITTNVGCSNNCKICPQKLFIRQYQKTKGVKKLTLEDFISCIDKVPKKVRIDFSGFSEPWLNPECTQMVLEGYNRGFNMTVYTTCVGMTTEDIDKIKHPLFFTFVVHLPDSENMKNALYPDYVEVLKYIQNAGINNIVFMTMGVLHYKLEELFQGREFGFTKSSKAGNVAGSKKIRKAGNIRCAVSPKMRRNILLPNGDVVLCCMDYGMDHVLGNLLKMDYEDLYCGQEYKNILANLNNDKKEEVLCRYCDWSRSRMETAYIQLVESAKQVLRPYKKKLISLKDKLVC